MVWVGLDDGVLSKVLRGLDARRLSLTRFELNARIINDEALQTLGDFLYRQKDLQKVVLPPFSATVEVVKALGSLPMMKTYELFSGTYVRPDDTGMCFNWGRKNAF